LHPVVEHEDVVEVQRLAVVVEQVVSRLQEEASPHVHGVFREAGIPSRKVRLARPDLVQHVVDLEASSLLLGSAPHEKFCKTCQPRKQRDIGVVADDGTEGVPSIIDDLVEARWILDRPDLREVKSDGTNVCRIR
jgi:hypothetical protein